MRSIVGTSCDCADGHLVEDGASGVRGREGQRSACWQSIVGASLIALTVISLGWATDVSVVMARGRRFVAGCVWRGLAPAELRLLAGKI